MYISIISYCNQNLDFIYFCYGLSFLIMGISFLAIIPKQSEYKICGFIRLFILFAIFNAFVSFIEMWSAISGNIYILNCFNEIRLEYKMLTSYIAYLFLFEFGRRLLKISKICSKILSPYLVIIFLTITTLLSVISKDLKNISGYAVL